MRLESYFCLCLENYEPSFLRPLSRLGEGRPICFSNKGGVQSSNFCDTMGKLIHAEKFPTGYMKYTTFAVSDNTLDTICKI